MLPLEGLIQVERDYYDPRISLVYYKGLKVGIIKQTEKGKIYISRRNFSLHYFRKFDGYGISRPILDTLKRRGVKKVIIIEKRKGGEFLLASDLDDWFELGMPFNYKFPDGTIDPQLVLPRVYMEIISD